MRIVEKLWRGEIDPSEEAVSHIVGYHERMTEARQAEKRLLDCLSAEGQEVYADYYQKQMMVEELLSQESFTKGFRLAGQLLLDMVVER